MLTLSLRDSESVDPKSSCAEHAGVPRNASPARKPPSAERPSTAGSSASAAGENRLQDLFAINMRLIRERRGLSQESLGFRSRLDRTYVSSVERQQRNISIRNIQRVADALDIDVRLLFTPALEALPEFQALDALPPE